jgi:hypothetical protein
MNKSVIILFTLVIIATLFYLAKESTIFGNYKEGNDYNAIDTKTGRSFDSVAKKYNDISYNLDIQFHDDYTNKTDDLGLNAGTAYIVDSSGNTTAMPSPGDGTTTTYFKPGAYTYGSSVFVPTYEDSVYLSRTANKYFNKPILETSSIKGGICNFYKNSPEQLEYACQNTDPNVCASTSCCVLIGGAKCVSGSKTGPTMISNYSDPLLPNKDYYYFQSKCYGNCPL